jgi:DNA-binding transcriptional LysR family regulator
LNIVARINDQEIIKRSVSKGMGISIMSNKSAIDYALAGNLLIYEPEGEQITRYLYIVFEKGKKLSRTEKNFIDFCSRFYQEIT